MDAFERHYVVQMKSHCQAGLKVLDGDSEEAVLDRKQRLLLTVNDLRGSKEFESQKKKFARHFAECVEYFAEKKKKKGGVGHETDQILTP